MSLFSYLLSLCCCGWRAGTGYSDGDGEIDVEDDSDYDSDYDSFYDPYYDSNSEDGDRMARMSRRTTFGGGEGEGEGGGGVDDGMALSGDDLSSEGGSAGTSSTSGLSYSFFGEASGGSRFSGRRR